MPSVDYMTQVKLWCVLSNKCALHLFAMRIGIPSIEFDIKPLISHLLIGLESSLPISTCPLLFRHMCTTIRHKASHRPEAFDFDKVQHLGDSDFDSDTLQWNSATEHSIQTFRNLCRQTSFSFVSGTKPFWSINYTFSHCESAPSQLNAAWGNSFRQLHSCFDNLLALRQISLE